MDDVERLHHRKHLAAQFHAENRDFWTEGLRYKNDGGLLFDEVVLDCYEETLQRENIDPAACDISERRLKALFLRVARAQNGTELHAYLAGTDPVDSTVHSLLGYEGPDAIPPYEVLQREFRNLTDSDEIEMNSFEAAVTMAVYAVYRVGVVLPDATSDKYNLGAVEPPLYEPSVSSKTKAMYSRSM